MSSGQAQEAPGDEAARAAAAARKAEAELRLAQGNADKAVAEAAKAAAEARAAETTSDVARRTADAYDTEAARLQRAAESAKAIAEADSAAAKARRESLAALLPDLSTVAASTLERAEEGGPIAGTALIFRAIARAGDRVGTDVAARTEPAEGRRILVTSQLDLVTSDGVHLDVVSGIDQLNALIAEVTAAVGRKFRALGTPLDLAGAVAGAIPGVLSLLSAQRSLSTTKVDGNDTAAAAAVMSRLVALGVPVTHDDFRTVPTGTVHTKYTALTQNRAGLIGTQLAQADAVRRATAAEADATTALAAADADLAEAEKTGGDVPAAEAAVAEAARQVEEASAELAHATKSLAVVETVITMADEFIAAVRTATPGSRSLLTTAAVREQLHEDAARFSHVLLVKAENGQTEHTTTNLPLFFKDRFTTSATAAVTYLAITTADSSVVASGTVTAAASAHGKIGERYQLDE
ncbi:hypothetical protein [Nocardioides sp. BYT-33-1]|uniref:hypothetical protein n=1 Tax=Nocardioides sp. BYT-33-1 TaxID=3416952 RepID=UPI003F52F09C